MSKSPVIGNSEKQAGLGSALGVLLGRAISRSGLRTALQQDPAAALGGAAAGVGLAGPGAYYLAKHLAKPTTVVGATMHHGPASYSGAAPKMRTTPESGLELAITGMGDSMEADRTKKPSKKKAAGALQGGLLGAAAGAIPAALIGGSLGWSSQIPDSYENETSRRAGSKHWGTTVTPMRGGKPLYDTEELRATLDLLHQLHLKNQETSKQPKVAAATDSVKLRTAQPFSAEIRPSSWMNNKLISSPSFSTGSSSPFKGTFGQDPMSSTRPVVPTPQTPVINLGGIQTKRAFNRAVGAAAGGGLGTIAGALAALGIGSFTDHKVTGDLIPPLSIGGGTLGAMAGAALGRNRKPSEGEVPQLPPTTVRGLLESLMQPEQAQAVAPNPGEIPIGKRSKRDRGDVGIGSKSKRAGVEKQAGPLGSVLKGVAGLGKRLGPTAAGAGVGAAESYALGHDAPQTAANMTGNAMLGRAAGKLSWKGGNTLTNAKKLLGTGAAIPAVVSGVGAMRSNSVPFLPSGVNPYKQIEQAYTMGPSPGQPASGVPSKFQDYLKSLMERTGQTPDQLTNLALGAGMGAVTGGLMSKKNRVRNALMVALAGGGGAALINQFSQQKQASPLGSILKGVTGFGKAQLDEVPAWAKLIGPSAAGAGVGGAESYMLGHDTQQTAANMAGNAMLGHAAGKMQWKPTYVPVTRTTRVPPKAAPKASPSASPKGDNGLIGPLGKPSAPTRKLTVSEPVSTSTEVVKSQDWRPGGNPPPTHGVPGKVGPGPKLHSGGPAGGKGPAGSGGAKPSVGDDVIDMAQVGGIGPSAKKLLPMAVGIPTAISLEPSLTGTATRIGNVAKNFPDRFDRLFQGRVGGGEISAQSGGNPDQQPPQADTPDPDPGAGQMSDQLRTLATGAGLGALAGGLGSKKNRLRNALLGALAGGGGAALINYMSKASAHDLGYGFCPICGAPGIGCERSQDGLTHCANGHDYPNNSRVYPEQSSLDQHTGTEKSAAYLEGQVMAASMSQLAGDPGYACAWCRKPQPCGCDARTPTIEKSASTGGFTFDFTFTLPDVPAMPHSPRGNLAKLGAEGRGGQVGDSKNSATHSGLPRGEALHKSAESVRQHIQLPQNEQSIQQTRSVGGGGTDAAKADPAHCEKPEPPQGGALVGPAPAATRTKQAFTGFGPTSQMPPTLAGPPKPPGAATGTSAAGSNNFIGDGFKANPGTFAPTMLNSYQNVVKNQGVGGAPLGRPLAPGQVSKPAPMTLGGDPYEQAMQYAIQEADSVGTLTPQQLQQAQGMLQQMRGMRKQTDDMMRQSFAPLSGTRPAAPRPTAPAPAAPSLGGVAKGLGDVVMAPARAVGNLATGALNTFGRGARAAAGAVPGAIGGAIKNTPIGGTLNKATQMASGLGLGKPGMVSSMVGMTPIGGALNKMTQMGRGLGLGKSAASPGAVSKAFGPSAPGAGSGIGPNQKSVLGPQGGGISKMPQVSGGGGGSFATKMPSIGGAAPAAGPIQQLGGRNRDNDKMMMMPSKPPVVPGLGKPGGMQFQKAAPMPAAPPSNPKMHPNGNAANPQGFAFAGKAPPSMSSLGKPGGLQFQKGTPMPAASPAPAGGSGGGFMMKAPSAPAGGAMGKLTGAANAVPSMLGKGLKNMQGMLGLK